jgi:hypothetical protein
MNPSADDAAIREGKPPDLPDSRQPLHGDANARKVAFWFKCFWPAALGVLFCGCTALTQVPDSTAIVERGVVFAAMMAGPFCAPILAGETDFSFSPIAIWQNLGFLSIALIAAYPVKQSMVTAYVSMVGLALWFWAGFLSVIYCFDAG